MMMICSNSLMTSKHTGAFNTRLRHLISIKLFMQIYSGHDGKMHQLVDRPFMFNANSNSLLC